MKSNKLAQEWKGRLWTKVAECKYRGYDRLLTEQFIGGINNEGMTDEILREVATLEDVQKATSECILALVHRLEVQRTQRIMSTSIQEAKEFVAIQQNIQKCEYETTCGDKCKCCLRGHMPWQCPGYGKKCEKCAKANHFKENPCRDNSGTSGPRRCLTRCTWRVQLAWQNAVKVKYINLDSLKSVICTKLEVRMSQRQTKIMYKIVTPGQMAIWCHSKYSNLSSKINHWIVTHNK